MYICVHYTEGLRNMRQYQLRACVFIFLFYQVSFNWKEKEKKIYK